MFVIRSFFVVTQETCYFLRSSTIALCLLILESDRIFTPAMADAYVGSDKNTSMAAESINIFHLYNKLNIS
ncbi:hypothetical protein GJV44_00639 [Candidatus Vallotia cooleyia]|nr:hypothetical protein GJV44_00639 [Candidatus Vallotia cooleyia]